MTPAILIVEGLLIVLGFKGFEIVLIGATSFSLKSLKSNKTLVRRAFDNISEWLPIPSIQFI